MPSGWLLKDLTGKNVTEHVKLHTYKFDFDYLGKRSRGWSMFEKCFSCLCVEMSKKNNFFSYLT